MEINETHKILATLKAAFPVFCKGMNEDELEIQVRLWHMHFAEYDFPVVNAAVHSLISTQVEGYSPTIGAVKEKLRLLTSSSEMTEQEAWALVSKACHNGYYGYKEEFQKLPPLVQETIRNPEMLREWAQMDESTVQSVVASNFMRAYRIRNERQKEIERLPASVREAITSRQTNYLPDKEKG